MEQLIEFIGNHVLLVSAFGITLALLLWTESLRGGKAVTPAEATLLVNKEDAVLLDIRNKKDWDTGHITNAIHIPFTDLKNRMGELNKHKSKPVVVVCNLGQTAGSAAKMLKADGFENVMRLRGGMTEWKGQNLPIVK
ncbi:MAG: rhodanese-like domain-containing protein [Marinobacterium sp.]|nr:rhodanese-like domain-containing protein [Marinobacterium sp.]